MKQFFTLSMLLVISLCSTAQFVQPVNYRGAYAPAPAPMWTDTWTNWDPQNVAYAATNTPITGHITTNTTWTANNVYLLQGVVYVDSLVTLTIEPGTVIRGDNATPNSSLLVKRGGKLMAEGTAASPIVFTSNLPVGSRNKGDWGGVILLGKAKNNLTGGIGYIEGLLQTADNAHGGTDDEDNSGVLKYVRIEFGGYVFAPNSEINGLTFGSVGGGTTIDYVQVSFANDDSFEWFGGKVNCSHLVAYRGLDDDFDTDNGYSGNVQFGLGVRDPNIADNPAVSTSEGFESDNDANASTNLPQTSAVFSNITIIGPYRGNPNPAVAVAPGFRRGARLRRNTALKIFNSIFMDYATGLFIDGMAAKVNGYNGVLKYKNNIVALAGPAQRVAEDDSTRAVFSDPANANDSLSTTEGVLTTPYDFSNPDYRPAANSLALRNFSFTDQTLPISLVRVNGRTVNNKHIISWETATETNNSGFDVQRSEDGVNFTSIGFIPSKASNGNSNLTIQYSFTDTKTFDGKSYYRLKQTDKDGRITLSSILVLSLSKSTLLTVASIYPNPAKNVLNLSIVSPSAQKITVKMSDAFGRILNQRTLGVSAGSNVYNLNVQSLPSGNYYVNIITIDNSQSPVVKKFIKR